MRDTVTSALSATELVRKDGVLLGANAAADAHARAKMVAVNFIF